MQDVEVRRIAGAQCAVGEHVGVWAAALARDRVDALDELRAHIVQDLVDQRDTVVLAYARAHLAIQLLEPLIRDEPLDDPKDPAQRVEIAADDLFDVRVLDLDRDLRAIVHARDVDLADRRRCDRLALEVREQLVG